MGDTVLREGGLELGEALRSDAVPDAIILVHNDGRLLLRLGVGPLDGNGDDLISELARLVGSSSLLEGLGGELVLDLARDTIVLGDVLGRDTHGQQAVLGILVFENLVRNVRCRACSVPVGHRLNASTCEGSLSKDVVLPSTENTYRYQYRSVLREFGWLFG